MPRRRGQEDLYDEPPHFGNVSDDEHRGNSGRWERPTNNAVGPTARHSASAGPGILDQDYARRATNGSSGTMAMPVFWQAPSHSQPDSEHDARMADSLRNYISDSMWQPP